MAGRLEEAEEVASTKDTVDATVATEQWWNTPTEGGSTGADRGEEDGGRTSFDDGRLEGTGDQGWLATGRDRADQERMGGRDEGRGEGRDQGRGAVRDQGRWEGGRAGTDRGRTEGGRNGMDRGEREGGRTSFDQGRMGSAEARVERGRGADQVHFEPSLDALSFRSDVLCSINILSLSGEDGRRAGARGKRQGRCAGVAVRVPPEPVIRNSPPRTTVGP